LFHLKTNLLKHVFFEHTCYTFMLHHVSLTWWYVCVIQNLTQRNGFFTFVLMGEMGCYKNLSFVLLMQTSVLSFSSWFFATWLDCLDICFNVQIAWNTFPFDLAPLYYCTPSFVFSPNGFCAQASFFVRLVYAHLLPFWDFQLFVL
jgi:hypothetical protein